MSEIRRGIDVSVHQGVIDWVKVRAAGVEFAMLRACYSWDNDTQIDKRFAQNARGCEAAAVPFGLYHYSYAHNAADAVKEAKFFLRVIKGLCPEYPVAFDFEEASQVGGRDSKGTVHSGLPLAVQLEVIDAFMQTLEQAGYYAVLYSSASALERLRGFAPDRLAKYDCWVAHITTQKPAFGGSYGMWQYSWVGKIDGIKGDVDLNYGYRDYPTMIRAAGCNGFDKVDAPEADKPEGMPSEDHDNLATALQKEIDALRAQLRKKDEQLQAFKELANAI